MEVVASVVGSLIAGYIIMQLERVYEKLDKLENKMIVLELHLPKRADDKRE